MFGNITAYKKNTFFLIINKFWTTLHGVIFLIIINLFLSDIEIGNYYLMVSVLSLQALFEIGFLNIVQASIAKKYFNKEKNYFNKKFFLKDFSRYKNYYFFVSVLFFIFTNLYLFIFIDINEDLNFKFSYFIYVFFASCNIYLLPFFAAIDGLNKISNSAIIKTLSSFLSLAVTFILLSLNFKLYSFGIAQFFLATGNYFGLRTLGIFNFKPPIKFSLLRKTIQKTIKLQLKYLSVWISGYILFSLYVPLTYKFYGPVQAGKIGLTISIFGFSLALGNSIVQARLPYFSKKFEQSKYKQCFDLLRRTSLISTLVVLISTCFTVATFIILRQLNLFEIYTNRVLENNMLIIFLIYTIINNYAGCLSLFTRSNNEEIFHKSSMQLALLTLIIFIITLNYGFINFIKFPMLLFSIFIPFIYTYVFKKYYKTLIANNI